MAADSSLFWACFEIPCLHFLFRLLHETWEVELGGSSLCIGVWKKDTWNPASLKPDNSSFETFVPFAIGQNTGTSGDDFTCFLIALVCCTLWLQNHNHWAIDLSLYARSDQKQGEIFVTWIRLERVWRREQEGKIAKISGLCLWGSCPKAVKRKFMHHDRWENYWKGKQDGV